MSNIKKRGGAQRKNKTKNNKNKNKNKNKNVNISKQEYSSTGERIGSGIGGLLGRGAQEAFKLVTGFGDYRIEKNTIMRNGPPIVRNMIGTRGHLVRHREYITDVTASTGFVLTSYNINPGLITSFPWLSGIAESYEEYIIHGLLYEFKSTSSDAVLSTAANSALGTVIMATEYNSLSPLFVDKLSMENYEFATSCKPSECMVHPVECAYIQTPCHNLYVRGGTVNTGDLRLYDLGVFQIATVGQQVAGGVLGELWATYEIELIKPKMYRNLGLSILSDHWVLKSVTNGAPLGTTSTSTGTIGTTITTAGTVISFPVNVVDGYFLIIYGVHGVGAAVTSPTLTLANCVALNIFDADTASALGIVTSTTTNVYMLSTLLQIEAGEGVQATVTFSGAVLPTSVTWGDLFITQWDGTVLT